MSRGRLLRLLLVIAFVGVPLLEIFVLVQVGYVIGPWWTILLLIVAGILGTWLIRREGGRAWRALTEALQTGRMPAREIADGALILVGGTLMLAPGFVTDAVGVLLILPFTRPLARTLLTRVVTRRLLGAGFPAAGTRGPGGTTKRPGSGDGTVIQGEVVDNPDGPPRDPPDDQPRGDQPGSGRPGVS
ncbi:MAG: FxsA family protein [Nocardioides sp.]